MVFILLNRKAYHVYSITMNTPGGNIKYDYFQNAFNIKGSLDSI